METGQYLGFPVRQHRGFFLKIPNPPRAVQKHGGGGGRGGWMGDCSPEQRGGMCNGSIFGNVWKNKIEHGKFRKVLN